MNYGTSANGVGCSRLQRTVRALAITTRPSVACLSSSRDKKYVACAFVFGDASIRIWRVRDGMRVEHLNDPTDCVEFIELSGNGGLLTWG
ncbi:hypothetical protein C8Q76DRAFT_741226 [Earliella scabrosa]|nr:hypothetical protein C8Q76DRAFT_741226 [Earliella scabrosa]